LGVRKAVWTVLEAVWVLMAASHKLYKTVGVSDTVIVLTIRITYPLHDTRHSCDVELY